MWIVTEIGFYSIVSYDAARDPRSKPEDHGASYKTYESKGQKYGYWSYPDFKKPKRNPRVMVRARARVDLERLCAEFVKQGFEKPEILDWKMRDYPYRIVCLQREIARVIHHLTKAINYTNFKDHIKHTDPQGVERSSVYMSVWSALNGLERRLESKGYLGKAASRVVGSAAESARAFFGWDEYAATLGSEDDDDAYSITEIEAIGSMVDVPLNIVTPEDFTVEQIVAAAFEYMDSLSDAEACELIENDSELGEMICAAAYVNEMPKRDSDLKDLVDFLNLKGHLPRDDNDDPTDPFGVIDNPTQEDHQKLLPAELRSDSDEDDKRVTARPTVRVRVESEN